MNVARPGLDSFGRPTGLLGRAHLVRISLYWLGLSAVVLQGTDADTLRRAVGHIPAGDTPRPSMPSERIVTQSHANP